MAKVSPSAQAVSRWLARVVAMIGGSAVVARGVHLDDVEVGARGDVDAGGAGPARGGRRARDAVERLREDAGGRTADRHPRDRAVERPPGDGGVRNRVAVHVPGFGPVHHGVGDIQVHAIAGRDDGHDPASRVTRAFVAGEETGCHAEREHRTWLHSAGVAGTDSSSTTTQLPWSEEHVTTPRRSTLTCVESGRMSG